MKNLVEPVRDKQDVERIEKYLLSHSLRNRLIWVLCTNTGLRISDILGLNISSVKSNTYIELIEKKTKKYKKIKLNCKLQKLIKEYLVEREKDYSLNSAQPLFIGKKHYRLDRSQVYRFLNQTCKELKININVGTHTMRKTFGYHHYKKFNDVVLLQKIFNHSSPSITMRYIGIAQEEIDESYVNFEL